MNMRGNPCNSCPSLENLDVKTDMQAKIVVDEKTGTVVIGENVRVSTVVISHGNISVQIKEDARRVSQPMPFGQGQTVVSPDTQVKVRETAGSSISWRRAFPSGSWSRPSTRRGDRHAMS
jgi:flagellar P-ring protein precursor FlgI